MAMKSNDEFLRELYMVHGGKIVPLERYVGVKRKILFRCNICGNEWRTTAGNIMKTKNCPKCALKLKAKKNTLTHEEFLESAKEKMGQRFYDYEILGRYKNSKTKIKVKHKECGYEWDITPNNLYMAKTCPKCHGKVNGKISEIRRKASMKTNEEYLKELQEVWGEEYTPLEDYKGYNEKLLVRHNECGFEWNVRAGTLKRGHGCPKCAGSYRRTTEDYSKELSEKFNGKLELVSEFIAVSKDVMVKCNECGEVFTRNAGYLINNEDATGCPLCKPISSGEEVIRIYLRKNNIFYITQYPVKIKEQALRFDFAVYDENKIVAFIEYQGEQHYKPVEFFGGLKAFKLQKDKDKLKREYCVRNNVPLIEIPYWEKDIEKVLVNKLAQANTSIQLSIF